MAGGIANLFGIGNSNAQAQQTQAEEAQLLHEADLQQEQEKAAPGLIDTRNAQERELNGGPTNKWNASETLLGDVAKETAAGGKSVQPTNNSEPVALGV
jgi:hypothetical protein